MSVRNGNTLVNITSGTAVELVPSPPENMVRLVHFIVIANLFAGGKNIVLDYYDGSNAFVFRGIGLLINASSTLPVSGGAYVLKPTDIIRFFIIGGGDCDVSAYWTDVGEEDNALDFDMSMNFTDGTNNVEIVPSPPVNIVRFVRKVTTFNLNVATVIANLWINDGGAPWRQESKTLPFFSSGEVPTSGGYYVLKNGESLEINLLSSPGSEVSVTAHWVDEPEGINGN